MDRNLGRVQHSLSEFSEDADGNVCIAGREASVYVFNGRSVEVKTVPIATPITTIRIAQRGNLLFMLGFPTILELHSGVSYTYDHLYLKDRKNKKLIIYIHWRLPATGARRRPNAFL